MSRALNLTLILATIAILTGTEAKAQFIISEATNLFSPSFRDGSGADANHTTWFGWTYFGETSPGSGVYAGGFDGTPDNEIVDNPYISVGAGGLDGQINQATTVDILASSNGIYRASNYVGDLTGTATEKLTISTPINVSGGDIGTGFTTIIVQGHSATSAYGASALYLTFGSISGVNPTFLLGTNSSTGAIGLGQFWVKYEIAGSAASYDVDFFLPKGTSISGLQVDTQWSASGFAADYAVLAVPEPSTGFLFVLGGVLCLWKRRLSPA